MPSSKPLSSILFCSLLLLVLLGDAARAAPWRRAALPTTDPPFTTPDDVLVASLQCPLRPGMSYKGVTNPVLLVPGTGTNGS